MLRCHFERSLGRATAGLDMVLFFSLSLIVPCSAQSPDAAPAAAESLEGQPSIEGQHWAVIIAGLPGDGSHAELFRETLAKWRQALIDAGIAAERLSLLWADSDSKQEPITRADIAEAFAAIGGQIESEDTLWIFFLGHGNYNDGRPAFHVRGPDLDDADIAGWLDGIQCRRQVVWLTNSCSGWFLKRLSATSRIVITATAADQEPNETEFPLALATILAQPAEVLDADADNRVSVFEIFAAAVKETEARYTANRRIPTEHAQLDDNGDGKGTELPDIKAPQDESSDIPENATALVPAPTLPSEGRVARTTYLPRVISKGDELQAPEKSSTP